MALGLVKKGLRATILASLNLLYINLYLLEVRFFVLKQKKVVSNTIKNLFVKHFFGGIAVLNVKHQHSVALILMTCIFL